VTVPNGGGANGWGSGPGARRGLRGKASVRHVPVLDKGWDAQPVESLEAQPANPDRRPLRPVSSGPARDYRSPRFRGPGRLLGFGLFTLVLAGLVTGGLYFVARPIVVGGIVDWAAGNATAQQLPFVSEIVRGELGSKLTAPIDATDKATIVIVIGAGDTPAQIGDDLVRTGAIADARAFVFDAIQRDVSDQFQIGRHVVSRSMTVDQIVSILIQPPVAPPTVRITFREGLRIEQMVAKIEYLEAQPVDPTAPLTLNPAQFYDLARNPPADLLASYPWLKLPDGASLEGFLFPATYDVAPDTTPIQLLGMLLDAFASHAPPGLLDLPPERIYRIVQVASLVESEAKVDADRALIAGVYTNRLNPKMWPTGLLDADPTLNYANDSVWLRANPIATWVDFTFWTTINATGPLSKVVFPGELAAYNTYSHAGLQPTPIDSPSATSLLAAMTPDTADGYLYFLAKNDGSGTHAFAKTQAEQDANAKKYGY
jgi:UPF0755 protein